MKIDWKDIGIRAGKTFIQAGLSCLVASLPGVDIRGSPGELLDWLGPASTGCRPVGGMDHRAQAYFRGKVMDRAISTPLPV